MSDYTTKPPTGDHSPDKPTWILQENLVDGLLPRPGYNPPYTSVSDYPKNAREFPKRTSPLVAWYGNAAPAGCYVSDAGVVTSTNAPTP